MFREEMQGIRAKYKILWFAVDLHHRERYFFICGYKLIVKIPVKEAAG
jgi:hypothetical protein